MQLMAKVSPEEFPDPVVDAASADKAGQSRAILAGGCFWCVEAVYKNLDGVSSVKSGYAGGTADTADYETVSSGTTDHAESVEVVYDPSRITFGQILRVFFSIAHDPTQLNRQGPDTGRQYRSAIFYSDDEQKGVAEAYIDQLNKAHVFDRPIVTEVVPLQAFFEAETYHQDYAARNPLNPYIVVNAQPKVRKLRSYQAAKEKVSNR
ncbi:MAG: peptide-methionine (S)-S-oxide reductase [Chloroflexota bacterium]|jgi:peptide-methionine (S)-S-oxide reductase|nr:peptide-methionine (S)-S-oxide reductase [Chloroflexota bacterium]